MKIKFLLLFVVTPCTFGNTITQPDLSRKWQVGEIVDLRNGQTTGTFLAPLGLLGEHTHSTRADQSTYSFTANDRFKDRAKLLHLELDVRLEVQGGRFKLSGAAELLKYKKGSSHIVHAHALSSIHFTKKVLDTKHPELMQAFDTTLFDNPRGTHVVTQVILGVNYGATFELRSENSTDRDLKRAWLYTKISAGAFEFEGNVSFLQHSEDKQWARQTTVRWFGDVIPSKAFPTDPQQALTFVRNIHTEAISTEGVPVLVVLTPLSELDNKVLKNIREISNALLDAAGAVFDSFEESSEHLADLLEIPPFGFLSWVRAVRDYQSNFEAYVAGFSQKLLGVLYEVRDGTLEENAIAVLLTEHQQSEFTQNNVNTATEQFLDHITTLKALVTQMKQTGGVTIAEHYRDFLAPTWDSLYSAVYVLILVGETPPRDRGLTDMLRQFYSLALARKRDAETVGEGNRPEGVTHCVAAAVGNSDKPQCIQNLKFVVIHFDSFRSTFCPPHELPAPTCKGRRPLSSCWCTRPETAVLEYLESQSPKQVTRLPTIPAQATIESVTYGLEYLTSSDPQNQWVEIVLSYPEDGGVVTSWHVQALWYESEQQEDGSLHTSTRVLHVHTTGNLKQFYIGGLVSGRSYQFKVSGINFLSEGQLSEAYPTDGTVMVGENRATIVSTIGDGSKHNEGPSWLDFEVNVQLSVQPNKGRIARVEFWRNVTLAFKCEQLQTHTASADCIIPTHDISEDAEAFHVRVLSTDSELIATGDYTSVSMGDRTCAEWDPEKKLFCTADPSCVVSCADCNLNGVQTVRYGSICHSDKCPGKIWCPVSNGCLFPEGSLDATCSSYCSAASTATTGAGGQRCLVPCNLKGLPSSVEIVDCERIHNKLQAPGTTCTLKCKPRYSPKTDSPASHQFECPSDNDQGEHVFSSTWIQCEKSSCEAEGDLLSVDVFEHKESDHRIGTTKLPVGPLESGSFVSINCDQQNDRYYGGGVTVICDSGNYKIAGKCYQNGLLNGHRPYVHFVADSDDVVLVSGHAAEWRAKSTSSVPLSLQGGYAGRTSPSFKQGVQFPNGKSHSVISFNEQDCMQSEWFNQPMGASFTLFTVMKFRPTSATSQPFTLGDHAPSFDGILAFEMEGQWVDMAYGHARDLRFTRPVSHFADVWAVWGFTADGTDRRFMKVVRNGEIEPIGALSSVPNAPYPLRHTLHLGCLAHSGRILHLSIVDFAEFVYFPEHLSDKDFQVVHDFLMKKYIVS